MIVDLDCRHFPGDRPCVHHKTSGAICETCKHGEKVGFRVLIIKLDALGDVLRTTCILPAIRSEWPRCQITWITSPEAIPLLSGNPLIDERCSLHDAPARLAAEHFDLVLNPDASKRSAALASMASANEKRGYLLRPDGQVVPANDEAADWLVLGARDDMKKANRETYQSHIHRQLCLDPSEQQISLILTASEREDARRLLAKSGVSERPMVGLNTGSSKRWKHKSWIPERFAELARLLAGEKCGPVVLIGGPAEQDQNRWIEKASGGSAVAIDTGSGLRAYAALVGSCGVLVTGDTLGLHVAIALERRVVALFGPTSSSEIDLYGCGIRVVPDLDCICCYQGDCDVSPHCMESISVESVLSKILDQAGLVPEGMLAQTI